MALPLPQDALEALAKETMHDRIVGCLFGSALGDAIGLYTEFLSGEMARLAYLSLKFILSPPSEATPFRRDAHRDPNVPGEWTDDTDHAMCILLSYLHTDGKWMSPHDFAYRLHIWVRMGLRALDTLPLGLGRTVGAIVRSKTYLEDPEGTARRHWRNAKCKLAPNGSIMRTHPLGLMCIHKTMEETFQVAADYSVVTHVDPRCIISCVIGTALVRGLVRHEIYEEEHIDHVVEQAIAWYSGYRSRQIERDPSCKDEPELDLGELNRHVKVKNLADLELDDMYKIGYTYKTFGSGIFLLRLAMREVASAESRLSTQQSVFERLITDLTMQGGDADTNACFAGALLGSYLGYKTLPSHWRDGLKHGEWLMKKAEGLSILLGIGQGAYSGSRDKDTAPDGGRGWLTESQMEEKVMLLQADMVKRSQERDRMEEAEKRRARTKRGSWLGGIGGKW
ncbi:ADP-ribosylglycohydrolase-like protein [Trichoderma citrinoviride]|uniref:ADP-ribosylglycohydrolase-like protein n=1 Tax=Trichoderma citrinoviride TaxID=58853 RepID=A0A2T4BEJ6_9HYPO|nr:ADP-ribosylglycohydrolase-like protein [Trichoderma citrinoviride]PTB67735.1 ADP-ribosylglycohydrolase-like protein [Trichoderma citrinoviride]